MVTSTASGSGTQTAALVDAANRRRRRTAVRTQPLPTPPAATRPETIPIPAGRGRVADPSAVHLTQHRSPLLPDGIPAGAGNGNCGPTSALIALRLLGLDLPGHEGQRTQAAIDAARMVATGALDRGASTTKAQQARVLVAGGAQVMRTRSLAATLDAVRRGAVAVIGGNTNARGWYMWSLRDPAQINRVAGHAVVVSQYIPELDEYVVNDPMQSRVVHVSAAQLTAFTDAHAGAAMTREALVAYR